MLSVHQHLFVICRKVENKSHITYSLILYIFSSSFKYLLVENTSRKCHCMLLHSSYINWMNDFWFTGQLVKVNNVMGPSLNLIFQVSPGILPIPFLTKYGIIQYVCRTQLLVLTSCNLLASHLETWRVTCHQSYVWFAGLFTFVRPTVGREAF